MSDLEKQLNCVYSERAMILACFAKQMFDSGLMQVGVAQHDENDKEWDPEWRTILVLQNNENYESFQFTWHFHDNDAWLLDSFPKLENYKWNGHTTEQKYNRLLEFFGFLDNLPEAPETEFDIIR